MKSRSIVMLCAAAALAVSCQESVKSISDRVFERATVQFAAMDERMPADSVARTFDDGRYVNAKLNWWCSGFYPGCLWYIYEYNGNEAMKDLAVKHTLKLNGLCDRVTHHDIGFQINCSYGNAYRLTGDGSFLPIIEEAAAKLAKRFNPVVGCTKSWDNKKYTYPVIIDNMMNLELLAKASKMFSCDSLMDIACTHANTTIANHFRDDYSTWHLVDYDPGTGGIIRKQTVQGYADETSWSRGQAWGLYGYTMMYKETGEEAYLAQAGHIADYIIPLLPEDGIPYWDFNAPGTPNAVAADAPGHPKKYEWMEGDPVLRDSSAGAIIASALVDLSTLTKDSSASGLYLRTAEKIIRTLASPEYLAEPGENGDFLLKHGVGNLHGNSEVDVPLIYGDYYFLEALVRYNKL